jgi:hypothetical protein
MLGVGDSVGDTVGVSDSVGDTVGVGDSVTVALGVGDSVTVALGVGDSVGDTVGVGDSVGDTVGVGDSVGDTVGVGDSVTVGVGTPVGLTVGVGDSVGDMVGVGVGAAATCTESLIHVAFISCAKLSYNTLTLTLNTNPLLSQTLPTTSKSIHDRLPLPLTPEVPATLFITLNTPCTPSGMNPQASTGMAVPLIDPLLTPVTCITLAL